MKGTAALVMFMAALFGSFLKDTFDPKSNIPEAKDVIEYFQEKLEE